MEQLPLEMIEQIAINFPLTHKGLDDLLNYCKVFHICQDEHFWRRLYKEKISSAAQYPPVGNSWEESYIFFIRNRSFNLLGDYLLDDPIISDLFISDEYHDYYYNLRRDISGIDIEGNPFFLAAGDIVERYYCADKPPGAPECVYLTVIRAGEGAEISRKLTFRVQVKLKIGE